MDGTTSTTDEAEASPGHKLLGNLPRDVADNETAAVVLTICLGACRTADVTALVAVLEAVGLSVGPVLMLDDAKQPRFNPFRLNVVGDLGAWALARETLDADFYGRPLHKPNTNLGPAPRGRELADILLSLRGGT